MAVRRIQDIKPSVIESDVWIGPYDEARKEMESQGFSEIDLALNAKLRREQGEKAYVSQNGNWASLDFLILPEKNPRLTRHSIISRFPEQATEASRTGEFYTDSQELKEDYEKALEDSVEIDTREIPTSKFKESKIAVYAFGTTYGKEEEKDKDDARLYGDFLSKIRIYEMPIILPNSGSRPFSRKVWLCRLGGVYRSALGGDWYLFDGDGRVRGVREVSGEATAQKISESLDSNVQTAIREKRAFEYNGTIYVPTTNKGIPLKQ